jgi:hypothetical protein
MGFWGSWVSQQEIRFYGQFDFSFGLCNVLFGLCHQTRYAD